MRIITYQVSVKVTLKCHSASIRNPRIIGVRVKLIYVVNYLSPIRLSIDID
jgi:hypothetical protein